MLKQKRQTDRQTRKAAQTWLPRLKSPSQQPALQPPLLPLRSTTSPCDSLFARSLSPSDTPTSSPSTQTFSRRLPFLHRPLFRRRPGSRIRYLTPRCAKTVARSSRPIYARLTTQKTRDGATPAPGGHSSTCLVPPQVVRCRRPRSCMQGSLLRGRASRGI